MTLVYKFYNSPGIGDNMRGLISILQIQKRLQFRLLVDFEGHHFGEYLNYKTPMYSCSYKLTFIYLDERDHHDDIYSRLRDEFTRNDMIVIQTNAYPRIGDLDEPIKIFIKNLLVLRPATEEYLAKKFIGLPKIYNLFHYRLGDSHFNHDFLNHSVVENFVANKKENSVLISDSLVLKQEIHKRFANEDVYLFLDKPHHTEFPADSFLDTLADFYLIHNASSVSCHSCYGWISNFILWTAITYDVPLTNLK